MAEEVAAADGPATGTELARVWHVIAIHRWWWLGLVALLAGCHEEVGAAERTPSGQRPMRTSERERPFAAKAEQELRKSLSQSPIVRVKKGRGGRSLAFEVVLADGTRAYYKPEQTFAAYWFSEVASYHLDRELGLYRVPPVSSRRVAWSELARAAGRDQRVKEIRIDKAGNVRGAMIAWVDGEVPPLALPKGWERWLRLESSASVTPFQRVRHWREQRAQKPVRDAPSPDRAGRAAELSDLIVFDFLIGNLDRWSDDFTNVRTLGRGGPLIFLDNANGFERGRVRSKLSEARLSAVQRFRKRTLTAIEELEIAALERRLASEPLSPILDRVQLEELDLRRQRLLEHARAVEARHGARALPW